MKTKLFVSLIIALFASGLVFSSAAVSSGLIHLNGTNSNSVTTNSTANKLSQPSNQATTNSTASHHDGHGRHHVEHHVLNHRKHVLNLLSLIPNFRFVGYNSSFLKIGMFYAQGMYGNETLNKTNGELIITANGSALSFGEVPPLKANYVIINYSSDMTGQVGLYMKIFNNSSSDVNSKDLIVIPFYVMSNVTPPNSTFVRYVYANVTVNSTSEEVKFAEYVSENYVFFLPNTTLYGKVIIPLNIFQYSYTGKYQVGVFVHSNPTGTSTKASSMKITEWKLVSVQFKHSKRDSKRDYDAVIKDGYLTFKGKEFNASNSIMLIHGKVMTIRSENGTAYVTMKSKDVRFSFLVGNSTMGIRINSNVSVLLLFHSSLHLANFTNVTLHLRYDGKEISLTFHEVKEGSVYYLISSKEFHIGTVDVNALQVLKELGLKGPVDSVSVGTLLPSNGTVMLKLSYSIFSP